MIGIQEALLWVYPWVLLAHVAALMVFLTLHGASVVATAALRPGTDRERARAWLELSLLTYDSRRLTGRVYWASIAVMGSTGIALALLSGAWVRGWPWASAVVLTAMTVAMVRFGSGPMMELRRTLGEPFLERRDPRKPAWRPAATPDAGAFEAALQSLPSWTVTFIGAVGLLIILWLMVVKPF